jgi:hypothetical protein
MKLDALGNVSWCKFYPLIGSSHTFQFYAVAEASQGYVIAGSRTWYASGYQGEGILLEIDSNGNLTQNLEFPLVYNLKSLQKTADGGFICGGMEGFYNNTYPVVYKLNSLLSIDWKATIQNSNAFLGENSVRESGNGIFLATKNYGVVKLNQN